MTTHHRAPDTTVVEVQNLTKRYGDRLAVDDVSFSVVFISEATVKTHLAHVYARLGVNDTAAAVAAAYERGLLSPRKPSGP